MIVRGRLSEHIGLIVSYYCVYQWHVSLRSTDGPATLLRQLVASGNSWLSYVTSKTHSRAQPAIYFGKRFFPFFPFIFPCFLFFPFNFRSLSLRRWAAAVNPTKGLGSAVSFPCGVRNETPTAMHFWCIESPGNASNSCKCRSTCICVEQILRDVQVTNEVTKTEIMQLIRFNSIMQSSLLHFRL